MKKRFVKIIALALMLASVFSLVACGGQKTKVDAQALFQQLLEQGTYGTMLTDAGDLGMIAFSGLPEGTTIKFYRGGGEYSDCLVLFTLPSAEDMPKAEASVATYLGEISDQAQKYNANELTKIKDAVIWKQDQYLILCISEDAQAIRGLLEQSSALSADPEQTTTGEQVPETTAKPVTLHKWDKDYPVLVSKSGTYHTYGEAAGYRVDDGAFESYFYNDEAADKYASVINSAVNKLADTDTNIYCLAIPTAIGIVFPDDLIPKYGAYENQQARIQEIYGKIDDSVTKVECFENLMQHRDEYLYFRTDFHWNGRAAYYAYESFCAAKGATPYTLDQRQKAEFPNFQGALYQNMCEKDPELKADVLEAYYPYSQNIDMVFTDTRGNKVSWKVISDVSDWDPSMKYNAFAGGDNPITVYENPDVTDGSVGILVKDSFGNALVSYLVDHYSVLYEIDPRYWYGNIPEFAREVEATDLIFANNVGMIRSSYLIGLLADNI